MLEISSPIPKQTVGRTFVAALAVLGAVALAEFVGLGVAFLKGPRNTPPVAVISEPAPEKIVDPFASAAASTVPHAPEIPRELPKPKPVDLSLQPLPADVAEKASPTVAPTPPPAAPSADTRVSDLVEMARTLRARGDTATTITRLREAEAISPTNGSVLFELAMTYEKMGMADKAAEHWKKIYGLGESAGPFYTAAEAKLRAAETMAKLTTAQAAAAARPTPAAPPAPAVREPEGFQPGATLALAEVVLAKQDDPNSVQKMMLRIPIKGRPNTKIEVRDLIIHVDFYDMVEGQKIVRTNANVSSRWTTLPIDWSDDDVEVLEVEYAQPKLDVKRAAEGRRYFGFIIRVYYKTELQDMRAEPVSLLKQYPPPLKLTAEAP